MMKKEETLHGNSYPRETEKCVERKMIVMKRSKQMTRCVQAMLVMRSKTSLLRCGFEDRVERKQHNTVSWLRVLLLYQGRICT
jgi:hypothetical protein